MSELTFGIVTCGRPRAISRLLRTIDKNVEVPHNTIVLDNTFAFTDKYKPTWTKNFDVDLIEVDKKIGTSESQNILKNECDTKYMLHIDDDLYYQKSGVVKKQYNYIKNRNLDIISCAWKDTEYNRFRPIAKLWQFFIKDNIKYWLRWEVPHSHIQSEYGDLEYDFVESKECLKSMIVDTEKVYDKKNISWDEDFKWRGDLASFFIRCYFKDINIGVIPEYITHDPMPIKYGSLKKGRDDTNTLKLFHDKYGIIPMANWNEYWGDRGNDKRKPPE